MSSRDRNCSDKTVAAFTGRLADGDCGAPRTPPQGLPDAVTAVSSPAAVGGAAEDSVAAPSSTPVLCTRSIARAYHRRLEPITRWTDGMDPGVDGI